MPPTRLLLFPPVPLLVNRLYSTRNGSASAEGNEPPMRASFRPRWSLSQWAKGECMTNIWRGTIVAGRSTNRAPVLYSEPLQPRGSCKGRLSVPLNKMDAQFLTLPAVIPSSLMARERVAVEERPSCPCLRARSTATNYRSERARFRRRVALQDQRRAAGR